MYRSEELRQYFFRDELRSSVTPPPSPPPATALPFISLTQPNFAKLRFRGKQIIFSVIYRRNHWQCLTRTPAHPLYSRVWWKQDFKAWVRWLRTIGGEGHLPQVLARFKTMHRRCQSGWTIGIPPGAYLFSWSLVILLRGKTQVPFTFIFFVAFLCLPIIEGKAGFRYMDVKCTWLKTVRKHSKQSPLKKLRCESVCFISLLIRCVDDERESVIGRSAKAPGSNWNISTVCINLHERYVKHKARS